ncbi:wall-associated receptor kinase-like 10 isoform X2 [Morus notabilis]|uniref:wall-associated receptor kinase-like 10 isoform X2 n=1 Tax=Morus notabilis TaxID=981085 RepID=UPI000CED6FAE|nr:wall-associated receptor kinase-like 10 isoform X2 [Morus notabilis]
MVLQVLIHILLLPCLVLNTAASKLPPAAPAASLMAKKSCLSSCGNITIPFPFGIGKGCFIDEWFEVVCKNNATLVLSRVNLTVISIDIRPRFGSLEVKLPMLTFLNCDTEQRSPSLGGSPFEFDSNWNKFTAVGRSAFARMSSESDDTGTILAGCSLHCGTNSGGVNSVDHCQASIPSKLQFFKASFTSERTTETCYAFLVNDIWFSRSVKNISALNKMSEFPVVLNWILLYADKICALGKSDDSFLSNNDYSAKYPLKQHRSDRCYRYPNFGTPSSPVNQSQFVHCICEKGFEGNPYLVDGCKDIDECVPRARGSNVCPGNSRCENRNGSYVCNHKGKKAQGVLVGLGSAVGAMSLLLGSSGLYKVIKKRINFQRGERFFKRNGGDLLLQQLSLSEDNVENTVEVNVEDTSEVKVEDTREVRVEDTSEVRVQKTKLFDSEELEKATDRFNKDRVVGQGGRGTVYKGMLSDGRTAAIKKSKIGNKKEFIDEVVKLSKVNHRNVVKLLGCCLKTQVPLLVYEDVPNGTLSQYICDEQEGELSLTWQIRLRIATEVAGALSYLHSLASPIYHKDITSRNILLDGKYRPKVGDFGISRSVAIDQTHLTTADTFVYLDPDYFRSRKFTDKSDVYSFGVVLVELLTGQKPISIERPEETGSLAEYFMLSIEEGNLLDIVDARVKEEGKEEAITAFALLAKRCLKFSRRKRPTMKEVATSLGDIQKLEGDSGVRQEENLEEKLEEDSGVHDEENLE